MLSANLCFICMYALRDNVSAHEGRSGEFDPLHKVVDLTLPPMKHETQICDSWGSIIFDGIVISCFVIYFFIRELLRYL